MAAGTCTRVATLLGVALLAALFGGSADATSPGANGRIVFAMVTHESLTSSEDLFSMNADGTELRRLTWTPQDEGTPVWSPDGTRIAYARRGGDSASRIWVMNADGSGQAQLVPATDPSFGAVDDTSPTWSPDGRQIAFARGTALMVVNADGSGLRRVTSVFATDPDWSPDGTQLAYDGLDGIGVVGVDGSNPHTVSGPGAPASSPSWSPNGKQIVFTRNNALGFPGELHVMNADGSGERQLTSDGFENTHPAWSPDGTQVVFERTNSGFAGWRMWSIGADGSGLQQLLSGPDDARGASWGSSRAVPDTSPPVEPAVQFLTPGDADVFIQGVPSGVVFYECISYVSVIVSCQSDTPLLSLPDTSTYGLHTLTARATDAAGHTATGTATYFVFDLTPPTITVRAPADGATYEVGEHVVVDYSCTDPGGSGVAACLGSLPNGFLLDTSRPGTFTFTAGGLDNSFHSSSVTVRYTVVGASQAISFAPIGDRTYGDAPLTLSATGGASGNPVTFTASGDCTVSGTTLTITGAGSCTVTAHQSGGLGYLAAPDVSQSFAIAKAPQSIAFGPLPKRLYGDAPFALNATGGGSGNAVTFSAEGQCTGSGATVTITDIGSCTVTARQAGSADYLAAPDVARTFSIDPPPGCNEPGQVHGNEDFTYGSSDVQIQSGGVCAPSLQQAAVRVTLGGKQMLIDAGQGAVTSVTFTHPGDAVLMGSWNGTPFRIDLHDGGKGGSLDTLRVRYGDLDTGTLTAAHGDVLVSPS